VVELVFVFLVGVAVGEAIGKGATGDAAQLVAIFVVCYALGYLTRKK
jgi:hypothetical protein